MNKIIFLALLLLMVLAACVPLAGETPAAPLETPTVQPPTMISSATSAPTAELPAPAVSDEGCSLPEAWSLSFRRTGGFANFDQSLTVNSQGELQIESKRPPLTSSRVLSPDALAQLAELLRQACPFTAPTGRAVCADCFIYDLQIQWGDQAYGWQATEVTLPEEGRALIGALSQFFQQNTP